MQMNCLAVDLAIQCRPYTAHHCPKPAHPHRSTILTYRPPYGSHSDEGSEVLALVPYDVTLTVTGRQGKWFQVDYLGLRGWLSAAYVAPHGTCEL